MPDVEFEMTYPCFFIMRENGTPETVHSEGDHCICLFTDRDLGESFFRGTYGDEFVTKTVNVLGMANQNDLVEYLTRVQSQSEIDHVAIDASPGKLVGRATISGLIEELAG